MNLFTSHPKSTIATCKLAHSLFLILTISCLVVGEIGSVSAARIIGSAKSDKGAVAADDGRCSKLGVSILKKGGHAVDAAVTTALCLGVVNPMASGIGGGAFMVVRSSAGSKLHAYDMRETAPSAASQDMYNTNPDAKIAGVLSMAVPGEVAGLYKAWRIHGRLPWRKLFRPAIKLATHGFKVSPYLALNIQIAKDIITSDIGLRQVFAPNGMFLKLGDICYNRQLGRSLEAIATHGPKVLYDGEIGGEIVEEVKKAGGILTMNDFRRYRVVITEAVNVTVMGYTVHGMPPPSSGTVGLSLVLNTLASYGNVEDVKGSIGLHRMIEAVKHMFAIRMNLGDPKFANISRYVSNMLSPSYAEKIRKLILDNTTFPPDYYMSKWRWSQIQDHGTSHFCIVDAERNAVSMTSTVNYRFGSGVLSASTGIVLNNEMNDFSTPTEKSSDKLPPAPSNFIRPGKRPLSSMTPLIITKGNELAGVIGGSGGVYIIPAVIQVFLNHFISGMKPEKAVYNPRVYHTLLPNVVHYENWTLLDNDHIELRKELRIFLKKRGHELEGVAQGAICQLIVQNLESGGKNGVRKGTLIAVSDPRKDGWPAGV